jgi:hypothetical protein
VSGQIHAPGRFTPGEITPGTHWIGGWVGPRAGLDAVEKINVAPVGNRTLAALPIALRYTDLVIPTPRYYLEVNFNSLLIECFLNSSKNFFF